MLIFPDGCRRHSEAAWKAVYSEARGFFERGDLSSALNKAEQGFLGTKNDLTWNWKFRVLKAEILIWRSNAGEALDLLSVPPPPELSTSEFAVRAKATEAMALLNFSRYPEAENRLRQAEELASRTAPEMVCEALLDKGILSFNKLQYPEAERYFRQSLQLAKDRQRPFIEISALGNLGIVLVKLGRFDEAIDTSLEAMKQAHSFQYLLIEQIAVANLAWSYLQVGDIQNAISTFADEEKVIDKLGQDQLKQDVFRNTGETYFAVGNLSRARDSYQKAFAVAQELDRRKNSDEKRVMAAALNDIADLDLEEGKGADAQEHNRQALALLPDLPIAQLTSGKIAAMGHNFEAAKATLESLFRSSKPEDFNGWGAAAELANIYVAQKQNARAEQQFEKVLRIVEAARSGLKVTENKLAFSFRAMHFYDDYIHFLIATGQDRKALQVAEFSRARTLAEGVGLKAPGQPSEIRIEAIKRFAKQRGKIILAYWLAKDKSFLWFISSSGIKLFALAPKREIEEKAEIYINMLASPESAPDLEQKSQSLYELLVLPVQKMIPHDARVVIIPDGELDKLNFETLRSSSPAPHYWIEDVEVENASSIDLLIRAQEERARNYDKLLLIGNPLQASREYPALVHGAEGMNRIRSHFKAAQEASGKVATPSVYQSSHPEQYPLIHFVTHGTASDLRPLESAIILSPQAEDAFKLYARDIIKVHINADLVAISACYGAGKRTYSGEGLVGLAWSFLRAGAHQVVAGLWEVDEGAAMDLMDDFYTELQKGRFASTALRSAKRKMLSSGTIYRFPYYWASLQLYAGS